MLDFIVEFFTTPAIVIAVVALIGLLVQRKSAGEVIAGTIKTTLGFLILGVGAGAIVASLDPITKMFMQAYKLEGFVPFDELVVGSVAAQLGRETALILGFGFLVNLILARLTPWKYIYLTGHMLWIHAGCWAIILHSLGLSSTAIIAIGSIVQGLYTTLFPAMAQPFMRKITNSDDIAFGHGQTLLNVVGALIAKLFGDPKHSAEEVKVSDKWNFFRDMAISMSLIMLVVAIPASLIAGKDYVEANLSGGQNFLVFTLLKALGFTAGVLVLLQGVRMFIAEMVPAFKGIATVVVPGAKPALDCPVIYPYAPNSLMIGLISGSVGQVLAIAIAAALRWPIPIPSMIVAFFASGSGAIFANAVAGRRGAIFGGFFWSFAGFLLSSWAMHVKLFGDLAALGATGVGFVVPDGIAIAGIIKLIGVLLGLGS
ncbi:MAG: PTS ascorbate transporter subunit IIC [Firmicutes bacterium]|nr:PTS ascorbate transporter subunit IIC [Candidatus Fermentithermobacillaceae bacterium]